MSTSDDLEAAIDADPSDRAAYEVLADELQRIGDPRGELMVLQLARQTDAVIDRGNALILQHGMFPTGLRDVRWRWGFVEHFEFEANRYPDLLHPSLRFVESIAVRGSAGGLQHVIDTLATTRRLSVRELRLGTATTPGASRSFTIGILDGLLAALPNLQRLHLEGQHIQLAHFPSLTHLTIHSIALRGAVLEPLLAAPWPVLESLDLSFGLVNPPHELIERLIAHPFPSLTALRVEASFVDELLEPLARSSVLPRLRTLALAGGLSDTGAGVLAHDADRYRHLEMLELSHNQLSLAGIERVRGIARGLNAANQQTPIERDDELYDY